MDVVLLDDHSVEGLDELVRVVERARETNERVAILVCGLGPRAPSGGALLSLSEMLEDLPTALVLSTREIPPPSVLLDVDRMLVTNRRARPKNPAGWRGRSGYEGSRITRSQARQYRSRAPVGRRKK